MGSEARFSMKVPPAMRDDLTYNEWKHELKVWCGGTNVEKKKQGFTLAWSLTGDVRKTVMSEVSIEELDCEDGIKNVLKVLDKHFEKDTAQAGLLAFDAFIEYKRPSDLSIKDYLISFNLKYNAIKSYQMDLPDNILAALLLKCANLPEDKAAMCRATCTSLTYEMMKKQIEKVGCDVVSLAKPSTSKVESPFVKVEPTFHGNCNKIKPNSPHICNSSAYNYNSTSSSEEEEICENAFYGHNRNNFGNSYQSKPKLNPTDQFGIVTTCEYCKSVCHWVQKCPDAPSEFKQRRSFNKKKRSKHPL